MTTRILAFSAFAALALGLSLGISTPSVAGELDNERSVINEEALRAKDLPGTVIVRVNDKTGEASVLETSKTLSQDAASQAAVANMGTEFKVVSNDVKEIDQMKSISSWYVWFNTSRFYVPTYYYYGYTYSYRPCYSYSYYGYSYYWYRWW